MPTKTLITLASLCCLPMAAAAQSPADAGREEAAPTSEAPPGGTPDRHDDDRDGLMVRVAVGPAAVGTTIEVDGNELLSADGGGVAFGAQVGTALAPNLFLHGELLVVGTTHGVEQDQDDAELSADGIALGGAGAGLTYFFMPYNVSVGGTVMFAVAGVETKAGEDLDTDAGMLLKLQVDKQWQLAPSLGFGVGAAFFGGFASGETESNDTLKAGYAGATLQLVATYN